MSKQLTAGAEFPSLSLKIAGASEMSLPADLTTTWSVVLFYRGHW